MAEKTSVAQQLRDLARLQVRAGFLDETSLQADIVQAIRAELPGTADAVSLARDWVEGARTRLHAEERSWPATTDHDRLLSCFEQLGRSGVVVLPGAEDHWSAKETLERLAAARQAPLGIAWFTQPDVWHAIDNGMLEVNVWHGNTANAAPGDELLDLVLDVLHANGLAAHFDEGRIEVAAFWQRRLAAGTP